MADSAALPEPLPLTLSPVSDAMRPTVARTGETLFAIGVTSNIGDVEATWRVLEAGGVESPGQGFGFVKLWVEAHRLAQDRQLYITGSIDGTPIALLPLQRKNVRGVRQLAWFPGPHVGCNAPLVDRARLAAMTPEARRALWTAMLAGIKGADLLYLKSVPETVVDGVDIFAELGVSREAETLYRAQFSSWEEANTTQRSKSRRKHDRQQGERLGALGAVAFEELSNGPEATVALDTMFRQRAARFVEMGVANPFAPSDVRKFYDATAQAGSGLDLKLHVLRLNSEIVAIRYNLVFGDRMFCLISSMSDDASVQTGSPGKQCLLRVMQAIFDGGFRMFDMGAGFTDEKRHWCNVQIPVRQHYMPLSQRGAAAAWIHQQWQITRAQIKANKSLMAAAKSWRSVMLKVRGKHSDEECAE